MPSNQGAFLISHDSEIFAVHHNPRTFVAFHAEPPRAGFSIDGLCVRPRLRLERWGCNEDPRKLQVVAKLVGDCIQCPRAVGYPYIRNIRCLKSCCNTRVCRKTLGELLLACLTADMTISFSRTCYKVFCGYCRRCTHEPLCVPINHRTPPP